MYKLNTDGFWVAICMLDLQLQHVKQEFYTFKCRDRSSGFVLDILKNIDILTASSAGYGRGGN
jgi:hypothetical protein